MLLYRHHIYVKQPIRLVSHNILNSRKGEKIFLFMIPVSLLYDDRFVLVYALITSHFLKVTVKRK